MTYGTVQANAIQGSINTFSPNSAVFRNRIINGAMMIDQRNAGASVTPTNLQYLIDRWNAGLTQSSKFSVQQNAGSVTPPVGFTNYLGVTSLSAYSVGAGDIFVIRQFIEGFNVSDLGFGTANAKTVTISFWVRSSLTGTFGGVLQNRDANRCYPFTYTISAANTWEQKSVTIAGDTSGTWYTNNDIGMRLQFGLGGGSTYSGTAGAWTSSEVYTATGATSVVGTNGATFYITGVQLEVGSTATSFDYRPYGTELALCQRYYYKIFPAATTKNLTTSGNSASATAGQFMGVFPVTMRTAPTALEQSGTANHYNIQEPGINGTACSAVPTFNSQTTNSSYYIAGTVSSGLTAGRFALLRTDGTNGASAYLAWSAEL